jgi:hypothetical protein
MTWGENKLPPVGLRPFSVGDGGAVLVGGAVVVVVVVVVDGAWFSLFAHPAATDPIATRAAQPARAILKRLTRFELIIDVLSFCLSCRACDHQIPRLRALFGLSCHRCAKTYG